MGYGALQQRGSSLKPRSSIITTIAISIDIIVECSLQFVLLGAHAVDILQSARVRAGTQQLVARELQHRQPRCVSVRLLPQYQPIDFFEEPCVGAERKARAQRIVICDTYYNNA